MPGIYVKNSSWGLYTDNSLDAWRMAWDLGNKCAPIFHVSKEGHFSQYHTNNFIFLERHNHFHLCYGTLN